VRFAAAYSAAATPHGCYAADYHHEHVCGLAGIAVPRPLISGNNPALIPRANPIEPAMALADSDWFANHCKSLQTIAVCALHQPDDLRASGREQPVPVQSRQDRAGCTPPALLVLALSPATACCAAAAVAGMADRRPKVNPCPCRSCKPLQAVANFSNHRDLCSWNVSPALAAIWDHQLVSMQIPRTPSLPATFEM